MKISIEEFIKKFNETVTNESKDLIESLYIFGSLARSEVIQEASDIDSVLVLKSKDLLSSNEIQKLSEDMVNLDKKLGVEVDHVLVTQDDLFELLSPTLILNLHSDGFNAFGNDLKIRFKEYLDECSRDQMLNSFLRTDMFRRHQFRKKYLKIDFTDLSKIDDKNIYSICKDVILTARDLLFVKKDILITPKKDICSYFLANIADEDWFVNLPTLSYNIRYQVVKLESDEQKREFLIRAYDFMEKACLDIQKEYKAVTGKIKLDIRPF